MLAQLVSHKTKWGSSRGSKKRGPFASLSKTKKRLLLFIVAFSLIGGAYYVYSSFADTAATIENGNLVVKRGADVYQVSPDGSFEEKIEWAKWPFMVDELRFEVGSNHRALRFEATGGYKYSLDHVGLLEGSNSIQIATNLNFNAGAIWSPSGTNIAYVETNNDWSGSQEYKDIYSDIYVTDYEGNNTVKITPSVPAENHTPQFFIDDNNLLVRYIKGHNDTGFEDGYYRYNLTTQQKYEVSYPGQSSKDDAYPETTEQGWHLVNAYINGGLKSSSHSDVVVSLHDVYNHSNPSEPDFYITKSFFKDDEIIIDESFIVKPSIIVDTYNTTIGLSPDGEFIYMGNKVYNTKSGVLEFELDNNDKIIAWAPAVSIDIDSKSPNSDPDPEPDPEPEPENDSKSPSGDRTHRPRPRPEQQ